MNISRRLLKLKNPILNFNKISNFSYKKRIGFNHIEIQKNLKIERDMEELTETIDWLNEGAEIQSHFYHEFLFSVIGISIYRE